MRRRPWLKPATTAAVVAFVLLAFTGTAEAHGPYSVSKAAATPGASFTGAGAFGIALCPSGPSQTCDDGVGAFVFTGRGADPTTDAPIEPGLVEGVDHHHHAFATGTCSVTTATPGVGTTFAFNCGIDRNLDGFISDAPVCVVEQAAALFDECTGGQPEPWADDWVEGDQHSGPVAFCFQDSVRGFTDSPADDDGLNDVSAVNQAVGPVEHGDGWASDIVVFTGAQSENTGAYFGVVTVTVIVSGANSCDSRTGGIVSAHSTAGNADTDGNGRDTPECADTIDNDGDGAIDSGDLQCDAGDDDNELELSAEGDSWPRFPRWNDSEDPVQYCLSVLWWSLETPATAVVKGCKAGWRWLKGLFD